MSITIGGRCELHLCPKPCSACHAQCAERPAFVSALRSLVDSLSRQPTEQELRAAAHELTVKADRIAASQRRVEDNDG